MIQDAPKPPLGTGLLTAWCRKIAAAVDANRLLSGRGYKVKKSTKGVILEIEPGGGGGTSGLNWKDEWVSTTAYKTGDIVNVAATPTGKAGDGNNYTGVWLAVAPGTAKQPIFPYPEAPAVKYWHMIAPGFRELNVADSDTGSKKQLVAANDPYVPPAGP